MINSDMLVSEIMRTWSQTIPVFLRYRMLCVGCQLSEFDTLQDAIENYGLHAENFLEELEKSINQYTAN